MRITLAMALAFALGSPLHAQTAPELAEAPASVTGDLTNLGPLDRVRSWVIDWNGDDMSDLLVQAAYVAGGNSVYLRHFIYSGASGAYSRTAEFDLGDGIRSVTSIDGGFELDLFIYLDGDARCCPSGSRVFTLPR